MAQFLCEWLVFLLRVCGRGPMNCSTSTWLAASKDGHCQSADHLHCQRSLRDVSCCISFTILVPCVISQKKKKKTTTLYSLDWIHAEVTLWVCMLEFTERERTFGSRNTFVVGNSSILFPRKCPVPLHNIHVLCVGR